MGRFKLKLEGGATIDVEDTPIGEGAEKAVFKSCDARQAVYFFKSELAPEIQARRRRLEAVRSKYNPTAGNQYADFWKSHFCWPESLAQESALPPALLPGKGTGLNLLNPPLGFVAPIYPSNFFFADKRNQKKREKKPTWFSSAKNRKNVVPDDEQGTFRNYLLVCAKLSRAIRRLHQAGLAHSDLSCNNVLVDPKHGDALVIDVDALVVPDVAKPTVVGTQGYIAPEVLAQRAQHNGARFEPGINTDKHALAVLVYELLLSRHPLEGRKIHSEDPNLNAHLRLGANALFVEHPTDKSNALKSPPEIPLARLGPHLEKLFLKTFVDGLHNPAKRATAQEWELALYKTLDLLHPSPNGRDWTILIPGQPLTCMFTRKPIGYSVPVGTFLEPDTKGGERRTDRRLILYDNSFLCRWHIYGGLWPDERVKRPVAPEARCLFHRASNQWLLENRSAQPMTLLGPNTQIPPGKATPLRRGTRILLAASGENGLTPNILEFDFLAP